MLTLAVLHLQDRVETELNIYGSDWISAAGVIVGYAISFVIVFRSPQMDSRTVFQGQISATAYAATVRTAPKVAGIGFALHSYSYRRSQSVDFKHVARREGQDLRSIPENR